MKLKLLITVLVLVALFSGVVLWRVDRFVYGDRMAWAEAQARSQLSSLSQAIGVEIQSARRLLNTVNNDTFKTPHWKGLQPYYVLALMTSQGGALSISRMVTRPDSPAAAWTANELSQYMGFLGKELDSKGTVLLRSFKGPHKESHVAVIFAGGGSAYILVGRGENFQALIDSQKGSMSTFAIIASDGLTISHPMLDYVGTVMSDSTMLKEIRATGSAHGLGVYKQGRQQIFGMYEQVPRTNAYLLSTVPMAELLKGRLSLAWQFVFMLVGLGFIGAAIYFWQEKKAGEAPAPAARVKPAAVAAKTAPAPAAPPTASPPPSPAGNSAAVVTANTQLAAPVAPKEETPAGPPPPAAQAFTPQELRAEKAEVYRQVASALGQEMRAPLASILGFSQMVLAKTQEPEVVQAVESILREARSSRDVVEKLATFAGEKTSQKTETKIEGPIAQALKKLDPLLQQKGVRVERDFKDTSPWLLSSQDLARAFENLFVNAIESMERMQNKVLRVSVWEAVEGLHVRISDTGEGIETENLPKIFDPFFTTRSFANHVGLGLPVVMGILKEHQARIHVQSQRGQGTQVEIVFAPPSPAAAVGPKASSLPPPPPPIPAPELPADLPKISAAAKAAQAPEMPPLAELMKEGEPPSSKITEVNVESMLEMQEDEMPLQFLAGQGFDDDPAPQAPLPVVAKAPAEAPAASLKPASAPPPAAPAPITAAPAAAVPPPFEPSVSDLDAEAEPTKVVASMIIDTPSPAVKPDKPSPLDSYKVEIRRPGKRT